MSDRRVVDLRICPHDDYVRVEADGSTSRRCHLCEAFTYSAPGAIPPSLPATLLPRKSSST